LGLATGTKLGSYKIVAPLGEGMVSGIVSPVRNLSELYLIEGLK
jgi:hypothetical protein